MQSYKTVDKLKCYKHKMASGVRHPASGRLQDCMTARLQDI